MTPTFHLRLKRQDGKKDGKLTWTLPEFGVVLEGDTEQELQEQANIFLGGLVKYKKEYGSATFRKFLDSRGIRYDVVTSTNECLVYV